MDIAPVDHPAQASGGVDQQMARIEVTVHPAGRLGAQGRRRQPVNEREERVDVDPSDARRNGAQPSLEHRRVLLQVGPRCRSPRPPRVHLLVDGNAMQRREKLTQQDCVPLSLLVRPGDLARRRAGKQLVAGEGVGIALIGLAHERRGRNRQGKARREQRQHPNLSLDEASRELVAGEAEDEPPIDAECDVV